MKKILFTTGTRADYGKLKSIIIKLQKEKKFYVGVFVTGMHNISFFGATFAEIKKDKIKNIFRFYNQKRNDDMDSILSKTITGFKKYVKKISPDLIVVHGDRVEALACAIVGSLNNIKVVHIEGGEVSGTVDELIRHSVTKLSHIHMVTNNLAKRRLIQMGEKSNSIFIIGSPDVDIILSKNIPTLLKVKKRYAINFDRYSVALFHPVTTELGNLKKEVNIFIQSLIQSKRNYVLIYPNNDMGSKVILGAYKKLHDNKKIRILPSMRFEYYLSLLKQSDFIIGNSSSGIMEAPYYGVPTINLGNRQTNRAKLKSIKNCTFSKPKILKLIKQSLKTNRFHKTFHFGKGKSYQKFETILKNKKIWKLSNQKNFTEIKLLKS